MRIDFKALIQEWNEKHPDDKLSRAKLAREMVAKDYFTSEVSVLNMMRAYEQNKMRSINDDMRIFLRFKFGKTTDKLISEV